ncbi:MAG TPA: AraC family transcriptional regulator [Chitinophagaceae bacterium]|jgi:AraC-like DNA-binding protein|nr:AraC family transcriptional regulator [Chitinophagaceae bacterium]
MKDFPIFTSLYDTYRHLGLPVELLDPGLEFTVHNLTEVHTPGPYRSGVFRAHYFSFVFVKNGRGAYTTDELRFETVPGTIYFTNPGHWKSFEWTEMRDVTLITLSESFLKEYTHPAIFSECSFLLAETLAPRTLEPEAFAPFELLYRQIADAYFGNSPYKKRIIGSLFMVLLLRIKEQFWNHYNPMEEGRKGSAIVKTFKRNLERHYRDLVAGRAERVFRVQEYARLQHLHPNYLSNVIKSKTGKTVGTWIAEKTIAEAKAQLLHSGDSVKEIAYRLGFPEATHFSQYFRKHCGVTPVSFRKGKATARS